jgi:hypothetical protein
MANARQHETWNHTASLMALIANCHRDSKKRRQPYKPQEFHPAYLTKKKQNSQIHRGKGFARKCFLAFARGE